MGLKRHDFNAPAPVPALGKAETSYPTPNKIDRIVVERIPIKSGKYAALPYHSPHEDYDNNGLFLVWQGKVKAENNQIVAVRVYANDEVENSDWYNASIKYSGHCTAFPVYLRSYIDLRENYTAAQKGNPLSRVIRFRVTAGGTYTPATVPTAIVTGGGGGFGALCNVIMNPAKTKVIALEPINPGTAYTVAPTVVFSNGTAAATAFIQGSGVVLVEEETSKLDSEDAHMASLFIKVRRIYEKLPGPFIVTNEYKDERGPVTRKAQFVLGTDLTGAGLGIENATLQRTSVSPPWGMLKTWYEPRGDSAIVFTKFVETWTEIHREDKKVTSEFGGGILDVLETRDAPGNQTVDTGFLFVTSKLEKISPDEQVKITEKLSADSAQATLELIDGGTGFTAPAPAISFTGGIVVVEASADAVLAYPVSGVNVSGTGGSGYPSPPLVRFLHGGGGGGFAVAVLGFGIASVYVDNGGSLYVTPPAVSINGDGGGATIQAFLGFGVYFVTQTYPVFTSDFTTDLFHSVGHQLVAGDKLKFITSGTLPPPLALATDYYVLASGLTADDFKVSLTPGGAAVNLVTNNGSGTHRWVYQGPFTGVPTVSFGGDGMGAQADVIMGHPVGSITLTNPGQFYLSTPLVTPTTGGLVAAAVLNKWIDRIVVSGDSGGWEGPPTVVIGPPLTGGIQARAHTVLTGGLITSVPIDERGDGYETAPPVSFVALDPNIITSAGEIVLGADNLPVYVG